MGWYSGSKRNHQEWDDTLPERKISQVPGRGNFHLHIAGPRTVDIGPICGRNNDVGLWPQYERGHHAIKALKAEIKIRDLKSSSEST